MAVRLGRRGGMARAAKMTAEERRALARKAGQARWDRVRARKLAALRAAEGPVRRPDLCCAPGAVDTAPLRIMYDAQVDVLEVFLQKPGTAPNTLMVELAEDVYARVVPGTTGGQEPQGGRGSPGRRLERG